MTECIISLKTSMQQRRDFDHPLMDEVGFYKLEPEQCQTIIKRYIQTRTEDDQYILTQCYMWVVKDMVCRFRAHWPQTLNMTDDLVGVGLEALSQFIKEGDKLGVKPIPFPEQEIQFFNRIQSFIHNRMRTYINDNRSTFGGSAKTNERRKREGEELEYNFAGEIKDEITGGEVCEPWIIDLLDSMECVNDADAEEMRDKVLEFLKDEHGITPTKRELLALDELLETLRA